MTKNLWDEIVAAYQPGITSLRSVADKFGTNHHVVRRALNAAGVKIVKAPHPPVSRETRAKMSEAKKGHRPAWLDKPVTKNQLYANMQSHLRFDVSIEWLKKFEDFEKLKILNKAITQRSGRYNVTTDWYIRYIEKFYNDIEFNEVFEKWRKSNFDFWKKPSLDHIHPCSKGGTYDLDNLQFVSWFENRCKNHLSQEVWNDMKSRIWEYLVKNGDEK